MAGASRPTDPPSIQKIALQELIFELQNDLDKTRIHDLLENSNIPESEWTKYAFINNSPRGYSRNLIYDCEKFRLILICWKPGMGNLRHDHSRSHCYFKVLRGTIKEEQCDRSHQPRCDKTYEKGKVCHLESLSGTHSMKNCDPENIAVTLHLYIPPFDSCVVYDNGDMGQNMVLTFESRSGYATERETTLL